MTVVTVLLVTSAKKFRYLCYVTVLSIGFYAVKGLIFGIRTAAEFRVWGPPGSFIEDNNFLAVAVNMTLPFLFFLARSETNKKLRMFFWFVFVCGIGSVFLSYSRGGLLGLAVVLSFLAIKSRHKMMAATLVVALAAIVVAYAPAAWFRAWTSLRTAISTILPRNAWAPGISPLCWPRIIRPPEAASKLSLTTSTTRFTPGVEFAGPHSIYFQMLGEQGYVGLSLFVLLLITCHITCWKLRRQSRRLPQLAWIDPYTQMIQVSLLAYMISGAFLAMAYFDYFWQIVAMTAILKILFRRDAAVALAEEKQTPAFVPEVVELTLSH